MKKILLSLGILSCLSMNAQVLLNEGFESYTDFSITGFGSWQTLDLDGLDTYTGGGPVIGGTTTWSATWPNAGGPMGFQIFNLSTSNATNNATAVPGVDEEVRDFTAHGGQKTAVSWAGVPDIANANNDWLISPVVTLGATSNILTLWVKALSPAYAEKYKIGVYTGTGSPTSAANFTIVSGAPSGLTATATWQQVTVNLDAYAGQNIRVGIQYMASDKYMFMVDDVKITTGTLSTSEVSKSKTSIYPNPTKGEINIKTDKKIKSSTVFDLSGKVLLQTSSEKANISSFTKGTYLLKVDFVDGSSKTEKIIKD
ncbi:T9SS type A sorting domain-containing protein [Chryseobacterium sp. Ch-15]|uniref:Choice-of-anchor J domain-containing protein n=1 Tax=Chryseobacterium muglaense TaxID=2893752 RepID=A0A9Q3UW53_9FLAO|nr:choice-of-anchor J domain-containing protein [Chryseobacterium muglaense]MBD3905030.1 choice-of-anchor J domain-containing protein [Chryseobacterium muglaense]MCC9035103.1 T9SS type A sorting domain-containing protein [Chryseobacterium muglaense]MCM2554602.1 T9SS type A sorting domain-containing protein [Chryseobacterium muglaense]